MQTQTESVGSQSRGFFRSLMDLSFTSFVTARVIKFIYVISVIISAVYVFFITVPVSSFLAGYVSTSTDSRSLGLIVAVAVFLILTPLLLILAVTYVRVLLELVIVLFRISENTAEMVRRLGNVSASDRPPTTGRGEEE